MFTLKVMAFIGYALLALVIYQVADRYIISPEWYERADVEANELRARRNAEAYASNARAARANSNGAELKKLIEMVELAVKI